MVSITGGINWVKQQARDPHRYAVRAKEVLGAACSGAVFGAVSKAVRTTSAHRRPSATR